MIDSLCLQEPQQCLAYRCTQSWLTQDSLRILASMTDTMMTGELLPEGVLQTFSFTGTKDFSNVSAPTRRVCSKDANAKACAAATLPSAEQSAPEITKRQALTLCPSNVYHHVHTFLTSVCTAELLMINGAQGIAHLLCMLVCEWLDSTLPRTALLTKKCAATRGDCLRLQHKLGKHRC